MRLQRLHQAVGMVLALGVARDLGADHAGGVVVVLGAAHAADGALVEHLDLERAGRRAIVRTGGRADANRRRNAPHRFVHRAIAFTGCTTRRLDFRLLFQPQRDLILPDTRPDQNDDDGAGDPAGDIELCRRCASEK